jgi:hypothetical protein
MTHQPTGAAWAIGPNPEQDTLGVRVLFTPHAVAIQVLTRGVSHPRWEVTHCGTPDEARQTAAAITARFAPGDDAATLQVLPLEVMAHPTEIARLYETGKVSPSLRARIYTALVQRRNAARAR